MKQLRAMVLNDLQAYVPQGYFEREIEDFRFSPTIESAAHFSGETTWGYLAADLAKKLLFEPASSCMSARQVAASDLLMQLGMLVSMDATSGVAAQLSQKAKNVGFLGGNVDVVTKQLVEQHIPVLMDNVKGALEQYLRHLTPEEARPFHALLETQAPEEDRQRKQAFWDRVQRHPIYIGLAVVGSIASVIGLISLFR